MTQEIKLKLEQVADDYGFRVPYDNSMNFYDLDAIKHFKAGAQTILDNPKEWGLRTKEEYQDILDINTNQVIVWEKLRSENERYREALEDVINNCEDGAVRVIRIAKEALKQEEQ